MNQGAHPEELPAEVLDDVASVVGAEVTLLSRLPKGVNAGAMRVQLPEGQMQCSKQSPGHTPTTWTRRYEPRESSSTCVGAAIPRLPGSEWGHSHSCLASDGLR
jgi:hypothetical protein